MPASSLGIPLAIATQNRCRSSLLATGGAPANASPGGPPEQPPIPVAVPFAHLHMKVLRRPVEFAQYTSVRYGESLMLAGLAGSAGTVGDAYDNALAETTIGLYKAGCVRDGSPFRGGPLRSAGDIEKITAARVHWYNHERLMHRTGLRPPAEAGAACRASRRPA